MAKQAGVLRYPYEAITDKTDYLQLTIKKYSRIGEDAKEKFIQDTSFGLNSQPLDVQAIAAAALKPMQLAEDGVILLPMPSNIQDSNSVSYDNDSMNALAAFGAGAVQDVIKSPDPVKSLLDVIGKPASATGGTNGAGTPASGIFKDGEKLKDLALKALTAQAVNVFGAGVSLNQLLAREGGKILNPNMELLFNNVTLRTFRFSFKMTPRDENESLQVKSIIRSLKRNMAPKRGDETGLFLDTPNIFELNYKKGKKLHPFLHRFKQCALSDMSVNYTGENVYATYGDGTPISVVMNLTFKELVPIYQEDYLDSAFENDTESKLDKNFKDQDLKYGITSKEQNNVEGVGF